MLRGLPRRWFTEDVPLLIVSSHRELNLDLGIRQTGLTNGIGKGSRTAAGIICKVFEGQRQGGLQCVNH